MELNCRVFSDENMIIMCGSCFLALLFCMFVGIMFCDQISCIVNNTSTIDNLKKRNPKFEEEAKSQKSEGRTGWQNLEEVFGGSIGLGWLYPLDIKTQLDVEREYD